MNKVNTELGVEVEGEGQQKCVIHHLCPQAHNLVGLTRPTLLNSVIDGSIGALSDNGSLWEGCTSLPLRNGVWLCDLLWMMEL